MKNLSLIFLFLLFSSCANEKKTFWCGDHACINKQERMQYFKENMTVEVKTFANEDVDNNTINKILTNDKKIKKAKYLKDKEYFKKEKKRLKMEKKIAKKKALEEKKIAKNKLIKEKKKTQVDNVVKKDKSKVSEIAKIYTLKDDFDMLVEKVTNRNMSKPFPNINDIPN